MNKAYAILWFVISLICVLHFLYRYLARKSVRETEKKQKIRRVKALLLKNKPLLAYYSEQVEKIPTKIRVMPAWFRQEVLPLSTVFEEKVIEYCEASEAISQILIQVPEEVDEEKMEKDLDRCANALSQAEQNLESLLKELYAAEYKIDSVYKRVQELVQHLLKAAIAIPDAEVRADFKNKIRNELRAADDYYDHYSEVCDPRPLSDSIELIKERIITVAEILNREGKAKLAIPEDLKK